MATEIVMPALEMAQDSGRLVRWLKAEAAAGAFLKSLKETLENPYLFII